MGGGVADRGLVGWTQAGVAANESQWQEATGGWLLQGFSFSFWGRLEVTEVLEQRCGMTWARFQQPFFAEVCRTDWSSMAMVKWGGDTAIQGRKLSGKTKLATMEVVRNRQVLCYFLKDNWLGFLAGLDVGVREREWSHRRLLSWVWAGKSAEGTELLGERASLQLWMY